MRFWHVQSGLDGVLLEVEFREVSLAVISQYLGGANKGANELANQGVHLDATRVWLG